MQETFDMQEQIRKFIFIKIKKLNNHGSDYMLYEINRKNNFLRGVKK